MVFLTLAQKLNQFLGPVLLRHGINARYAAAGGKLIVDNPTADALCLLPFAQKIIDVEVYTALRGNTSANERIGILESYIRSALVPTEQWGDVMRWQFHQRLQKWLRRHYLVAKHGPELYNLPISLRKSPQLSRDKSTEVTIPSTMTLVRSLGMEDWTTDKNTPGARSAMKDIVENKLGGGELLVLRGGAICFAHVQDPQQDVSHLTLEELLEVAGCHVAQCSAFNALCEEAEIYQFWTREYIQKLALYLQSRMEEGKDTLLVDIGAGDGLLASLLRNTFHEIQTKSIGFNKSIAKIPDILATDNGSWNIPLRATVEPLSLDQTMKVIEDDSRDVIVICSWMPLHQDWTKVFRNHRVKEYILIGECDDGQCGDLWETWGNAAFLEVEESSEASTHQKMPPYELDGYTRHELQQLIPYQLSRFDCARSRAGRTWSFRRR